MLRGSWLVAVLVAATLTALAFWDYMPPLPSAQRLTVTFHDVRPDSSQPLIVTGEPGNGDFLYVKFLGPDTLAVGYDRWGRGGPVSRPLRFDPRATHTLDLVHPSLENVVGNLRQPPVRLRIAFNGERLLDEPIEPPLRRPMRLWFGHNPIGGSSCGPELSGDLKDQDGRKLHGGVRHLLTRTERFRGWLDYGRFQVLLILATAALAGFAWSRQQRAGRGALRRALVRGVGSAFGHAPFVVSAAFATLAFAWIVTCGGGPLMLRESFADFYDYQAISFLQGRLDVPEPAIGGEAFIHDGKRYGYFGPTPALLRLPFVVFGLAFGELTRVAMIAAFAITLLGAYAFLLEARQLAGATRSPRPWLAILFTLNLGLGSTVFFLGSRAYVYHEAISWGIAFAIWGAWFSLRTWRHPAGRAWIGALLCGVLSVHARPPTGLFALSFLGVVALALAWRERPALRRHLALAVAAGLGVLSYNAVSYLKFETFDGCPLRLNVQYDAKRLARIDGKQFHLSNVPFNAYSYLVTPNLLIEPRFPWLFLNVTKPGRDFPAAKMDYADRTLGFPYAMTGLSLFAVLGIAAARRCPGLAAPVVLTWLAAAPMALAMFAAVAIAQRYTADFCPFLICAAAFGAVIVETFSRRARVIAGTLLTVATLWSIVLTSAITLHYQGAMVWGTPPGVQERYQRWQQHVDARFR